MTKWDAITHLCCSRIFHPLHYLADYLVTSVENVCCGASRALQDEVYLAHLGIDMIESALHRGMERYDLKFFCAHHELDKLVSQLISLVYGLRIFITDQIRAIFTVLQDLVRLSIEIFSRLWRQTDNYGI